jgi:hypothetical protein
MDLDRGKQGEPPQFSCVIVKHKVAHRRSLRKRRYKRVLYFDSAA